MFFQQKMYVNEIFRQGKILEKWNALYFTSICQTQMAKKIDLRQPLSIWIENLSWIIFQFVFILSFV